jgi:3-isopropylmalate/(R)-2-methylmalate dehydratase small subunit
MEKITQFTSTTTVLAIDDVDTDQIVPARFLTAITRSNMSGALFADWRFDAQGNEIADFPLNQAGATDRKILVAGHNFGCGSSREHAPWALHDFGIRAVISSEIADIFRNNALKNGLIPIIVDTVTHQWLLNNPGAEITVDVEASEIRLPQDKDKDQVNAVSFPIDAFARHCLLEGIDQTGYLMQQEDKIADFEANRSWQP